MSDKPIKKVKRRKIRRKVSLPLTDEQKSQFNPPLWLARCQQVIEYKKRCERDGTVGHPMAYTPDELWKAAVEYFQWVEANPLLKQEAAVYKGFVSLYNVNHMQAMTKDGLCLFLEIRVCTLTVYSKKEEYKAVIEAINHVMRVQKFTGATAGLMNANIISRDLGLVDKQSVEQSGEMEVVHSNFDDVVKNLSQSKRDMLRQLLADDKKDVKTEDVPHEDDS